MFHDIQICIHPTKLTCPLKRDYFNRKYIFQPLIFRGHVSFRGSKLRAWWTYNINHFIKSSRYRNKTNVSLSLSLQRPQSMSLCNVYTFICTNSSEKSSSLGLLWRSWICILNWSLRGGLGRWRWAYFLVALNINSITLPTFNSSTLKSCRDPIGKLSSKHHFSGASC